jgi:hypothetical protein|tara:strand:+ start:24 stop:293 length:270 start_codon:yes stop_codon:yes gene_type:complete
MSDDYHKVDIEQLKGKMRQVTNPIYVPNPEDLELDQIPTLQKMLANLHFKMLEQETELDIIKSQIIAVNCAISALEKVKSVRDAFKDTK